MIMTFGLEQQIKQEINIKEIIYLISIKIHIQFAMKDLMQGYFGRLMNL